MTSTSTSLARHARVLLPVAVTAALAASLPGTANGQEGVVRTRVEPQAQPAPAAAAPATNRTKTACRAGFETWRFWWEYNQDRFRPARVPRPSDPTAEDVAERIVPVLKSVLDEDDADIVEFAVLALGRVVNRDAAETCSAEIEHALGSRHRSVRWSAILTLGILGAENVLPVLAGILEDRGSVNPSLRDDGVIPDVERGLAAIALGIAGAPASIPVLERVITAPPPLAQSVRAAAIAALGLIEFRDADVAARTELGAFLTGLLDDSSLADDARAQIPIALGRIDARTALPRLLDLATSPSVGPRFEESVILSLGALAGPRCAGDPFSRAAADVLIEKIRTGTNEQARHFAIIALADVAAAALRTDFAGNPEFARSITDALLQELAKGAYRPHEPFAAFALAIVGRELESASGVRREITDAIERKFDEETNPKELPAFALALGALRATHTGPKLMESLGSIDPAHRVHRGDFALALGLMQYAPAIDRLHSVVPELGNPRLSIQVAKALDWLGEEGASRDLLAALPNTKTLSEIAQTSRALGVLGDRCAIEPLAARIADERATGLARGFACLGLGMLADVRSRPWKSRVSVGLNYRTQVAVLREVLDSY